MSLKAFAQRKLTGKQMLTFRCNICGDTSIAPLASVKQREMPSCYSCGSTKRFRSIVAALSKELYGEVIPLGEFVESKETAGIGLSDTGMYAVALAKAFAYRNTFYHQEPKLDITSLPKEFVGVADFVIASDVFEHIPPPADLGLHNLYRLLRDNGVCIFSVPYKNSGDTEEHYPELFEYEITRHKGRRILINRTRQGQIQRFDKLVFHGGPGATLEMRLYSRASLLRDIEKAGFSEIKVHDYDIPEFGILNDANGVPCVISMRKRTGACGEPAQWSVESTEFG